VGCSDDIATLARRIGTVARPHQTQRIFGQGTFMVALTAFFIFASTAAGT